MQRSLLSALALVVSLLAGPTAVRAEWQVVATTQGVEVSQQGRYKFGDVLTERIDPRGRPYYWIGEMRSTLEGVPGTDVDAVGRGAIAVTPLGLDLTHGPTSQSLAEALA